MWVGVCVCQGGAYFVKWQYTSKTRVLNMKSNLCHGTGKIKLNCYMLL